MQQTNTEKKVLKLKCDNCKTEIPVTHAMQSGSLFYCLNCWLRRGDNRLLINYSYKPTPRFSKMSYEKNPLFLGIELEVEADDGTEEYYDNEDSDNYDDEYNNDNEGYLQDYAYKIMKKYPCYIKYDGSLNGHGMEIVTHPQTVKHHKKVFKWRELLKELKEEGFTSHSNNRCGLHIHLSKSWFKPEDFLKFNIFFDKNFGIMKRFGKRTKTNYCNKINSSDTRAIVKDKKKARLEDWYDHYKCLYFGNTHTLELRIFRGTLDIKRFNATLDMTEALSYYVKSYSLAFFIKATKKQLWFTLLSFMKQSKKYNRLLKYLEKESLLYCPLNKIPRQGIAINDITEQRDIMELMGNNDIKSFLKDKELKKLEYYFDDFEDYTINFRNDVYFIKDDFIPIKFEKIVMYNKHYNAMKRKNIIDFFISYGFIVEVGNGNIIKKIKNIKELARLLEIDLDKIAEKRKRDEAREQELYQKAQTIRERKARSQNENRERRLLTFPSSFGLSDNDNGSFNIMLKHKDKADKMVNKMVKIKLAKKENRHLIFTIRNRNN